MPVFALLSRRNNIVNSGTQVQSGIKGLIDSIIIIIIIIWEAQCGLYSLSIIDKKRDGDPMHELTDFELYIRKRRNFLRIENLL